MIGNLPGSTTPSQSGPESYGNDRVPHIPKTGVSPSDGFVAYLGHFLGRGLTPLQKDPADWVRIKVNTSQY